MRQFTLGALFFALALAASPLRAVECKYDLMTCGSTRSENLAHATCQFTDSTSLYLEWAIELNYGMTITVSVTSTAFPPRVQLYTADGERPVAQNTAATTARITYTATTTDRHWIVVSSSDASKTSGLFDVDVRCMTACQPPLIFSEPQVQTVPYGEQVRIRVNATGSQPLRFRWFDQANPAVTLSTDYMSFITQPMQATATFGLQLSNSCGSITRTVGHVHVEPCTAPTIVVQPTNRTVSPASPATFSLTTTGTEPLMTMWYEGAAADTSKFMGVGTTLTIPKATANTRFWARVTNACGVAHSDAASLTVSDKVRRRVVRP